ncbi:MATE family efflux transporter [Moorena sp. SIO4G3]|uniref:MATE family efflux transporter n=1 Tax=Moorena sp. SIO4G3 TaxID=2607821 RepID=UPI00142C03AC|nr:MATE family efflux transporter [Moorena sp. SIO4G3]NEO76526.1 MATE family efflux transporter [Moorena sp. SIO4G3]
MKSPPSKLQLIPTIFRTELISEAKASFRLAIPSVASQLTGIGVSTVDALVMGLLGNQNLAAGALGGNIFSFLVVTSIATLSSVGVLTAQAFGAGQTDNIGNSTRQGILLVAALSFPAMVLIWNSDLILLILGQEDGTILLVKSYLQAIVWGFPAALGFAVLTDFACAVNRPQAITVISVIGLLFNTFANYLLAFGKFGFPALGIAGIGWASTLSFWFNFAIAICWLTFHPNFREYKLFQNLFCLDQVLLVEILVVGWPTGIQLAADMGMYTVVALLMGYLGTESLAAHRIAMEVAMWAIMISSGISYATTMRVGQRVGQNAHSSARRATSFDIFLVTTLMSIIAVVCWWFAEPIATIFLNPDSSNNVEIIQLTISFINMGALYAIVFGVEFIALGALLGLKDTRVPMLINIGACWGVGLGGGYLLAFTLGWGGIGLWCSLVLGIGVAALLLTWRFYHLIGVMNDDQSASLSEIITPETSQATTASGG